MHIGQQYAFQHYGDETLISQYIISHVMTKPVFGFVHPVKLEPVCSASEAAQSLGFVYIATFEAAANSGCAAVLRICWSHMA